MLTAHNLTKYNKPAYLLAHARSVSLMSKQLNTFTERGIQREGAVANCRGVPPVCYKFQTNQRHLIQ